MKHKSLERLVYWIKIVLVASVVAFFIRGFIFIPMSIEGNSMETTLFQGDHIVYEKFSEVHRFDIIIFKANDGTTMVKRVIGLPGEHIKYVDDNLYINDKIILEPFLSKQLKAAKTHHYTTNFDSNEILGTETLSEKSYFVLGDNRRVSKDSRSFGEVEEEQIIGRVRMVYYPFKHMKLL